MTDTALAVVEDDAPIDPPPPVAIESSLIVGGVAGLARMSDALFEENLAALTVLRTRVDRVKAAIMKEGVDFGVIPGTTKPALLKPGAETLLRTFGLADSYVIERIVGDGIERPDYEIIAHAHIHIGHTGGPVVAEGIGAANTFETKHRYRGTAARTCPKCGKANVIHSKPPRSGWWCGTRDGGCGSNFDENDPAITTQPDPGKAENADPWDLANTVTKMAKKRALVDGILTATGTSGIFTQDEDAPGHPSAPGTAQGAAQPPRGASTPTPAISDGPAGLQGVVEKAPDGIRHVKIASLGGTDHAKLEIVMKVDRSRHTIIALDEVANGALVLELREGDIVRAIGGKVELIQWSDDPQKPKKKEVWGATDIAVLRDGAWLLGSEAAPTMPLEDPENRRSGPEAAPDPTTSSPTGGAPTEPAVVARKRGVEDEIATLKVKLLEPIRFHTDKLNRYSGLLKVADLATGEVINAVLGDDPKGEVEAQLGTDEEPSWSVGAELVIVGTWKSGWVILTAVGKAA